MKTLWLKLLGISKTLWSFLSPILQREAGDLLSRLLPLAKDVILEVAKNHTLPNARRDAALAELRDRARASGLNVTTSLLNLAIELAVQAAKD